MEVQNWSRLHGSAWFGTHFQVFLGWVRNRKWNSQEELDVDLQGGAGHGQLEAVDDVRVEDAKMADALSPDKDLCTAAGEEAGI